MGDLVERFVGATAAYSLREVEARTGVGYQTVRNLRAGEWQTVQPSTRRKIEAYLRQADAARDVGESPEDAARIGGAMEPEDDIDLPDVSYLHPAARAIFDERVGSYVTRGWPGQIISQAARELVAAIVGGNTVRSSGPGKVELSEDEQIMVLRGISPHIEKAYAARWSKR